MRRRFNSAEPNRKQPCGQHIFQGLKITQSGAPKVRPSNSQNDNRVCQFAVYLARKFARYLAYVPFYLRKESALSSVHPTTISSQLLASGAHTQPDGSRQIVCKKARQIICKLTALSTSSDPLLPHIMQSIFRPAARREALGEHSGVGRRDGGLKMGWTKRSAWGDFYGYRLPARSWMGI